MTVLRPSEPNRAPELSKASRFRYGSTSSDHLEGARVLDNQ
jgi:hypothetical protein